jgi:chromosome segregation ATPase
MEVFSMTQSFWESEAEQVPQPGLELHPQYESRSELEEQPSQQQHSGQPLPAQIAEPETLALSVDEFAALEERILRAVNLVKQERRARTEAEDRLAQAEAQLNEQMPLVARLQTEVHTLRTERDNVRQRIERLLSQLDALEL